jgi:hypothetical protein
MYFALCSTLECESNDILKTGKGIMNKAFRRISGAAALTAALCVSASANWAAPSHAFQQGALFLNPGLMTYPVGAYGSLDFAVHDAISVGGAAGYRFTLSHDWVHHGIPVVARAAFHPFNLEALADIIAVRDQLDVYVGPAVGFSIDIDSYRGAFETIDSDVGASPIIREFIGARYYFEPDFAVFAEEGSGLGWFNIGVTFRLR